MLTKKSRWAQLLTFIAVGILAAGCVRTAGNNTFEPVTDSGTGNAVATPLDQTSPTPLPTEALTEADATEEAIATEAPTDAAKQPTSTPIPALILTDTPTQAPPTVPPTTAPAEPSATPLAANAQAGTTNQQATTPTVSTGAGSGPSGPVDIVTNTPMPTRTPVTPAADLQPTPTDIMEMGEVDSDNAGASASSTASGDDCTYVVQRGDNPFRIAVNNNITLAELQRANPAIAGISPVIQPGQELTIPGCGGGTITVTPEPTEEAVVEADTTEEATTTTEAAESAPDGYMAYTVVSGDTLFKIATRYNTTVAALVELNNIPNPDSLAVGDEILVPDDTANGES